MPMDFPDMQSLKNRATQRQFRQPTPNETEHDYRTAFADFMVSVDVVESVEIRNKLGWDKQDPTAMLKAIMCPQAASPDSNTVVQVNVDTQPIATSEDDYSWLVPGHVVYAVECGIGSGITQDPLYVDVTADGFQHEDFKLHRMIVSNIEGGVVYFDDMSLNQWCLADNGFVSRTHATDPDDPVLSLHARMVPHYVKDALLARNAFAEIEGNKCSKGHRAFTDHILNLFQAMERQGEFSFYQVDNGTCEVRLQRMCEQWPQVGKRTESPVVTSRAVSHAVGSVQRMIGLKYQGDYPIFFQQFSPSIVRSSYSDSHTPRVVAGEYTTIIEDSVYLDARGNIWLPEYGVSNNGTSLIRSCLRGASVARLRNIEDRRLFSVYEVVPFEYWARQWLRTSAGLESEIIKSPRMMTLIKTRSAFFDSACAEVERALKVQITITADEVPLWSKITMEPVRDTVNGE